jgi:hypothetical protein
MTTFGNCPGQIEVNAKTEADRTATLSLGEMRLDFPSLDGGSPIHLAIPPTRKGGDMKKKQLFRKSAQDFLLGPDGVPRSTRIVIVFPWMVGKMSEIDWGL